MEVDASWLVFGETFGRVFWLPSKSFSVGQTSGSPCALFSLLLANLLGDREDE